MLHYVHSSLIYNRQMLERTQIPARRVLSALTLLQLEGHVQEESGKRFTLAVRIIP